MDEKMFPLVNFLTNNNFIVVNNNQSVGTLMKKIETNQTAKVIIKNKDAYNVYQESNIFSHLMKDWDQKKKIKTFINLNVQEIADPIVLNSDWPAASQSFMDKMINSNIAGAILPENTNLLSVIGKNEIDLPAGLFDKINNKFELIPQAAKQIKNDRSVDKWEKEQPNTAPKPYYIVSEFEDTVQAGSTFDVDVFLSREQGKKSSGVLKLQEEWQIDILVIPKSGLDLLGEFFKSVIVREENLNKRLRFTMKARGEDKGSFVITARYQGTELFHTEYEVAVVRTKEEVKSSIAKKETIIKGKPQNTPPDLTLLITQAQDNGKLALKYYLHSPDNSLNLTYKKFQTSIAQQDVGTYFLEFFNDIDSIKQDSKQQRLDAVEMMKGKGAKLYRELFPEELRRIFWNIRDKIKTILINSEEPWIPWEICFMYDEEEGITGGMFLCEVYEISRWISGSYSANTDISLSNAAIVIPSDSKLVFPPSEKEQMTTTFNSINAKLSEVTASFKEVRNGFLTGNYTVWHFSGHGTNSEGSNTSRYHILLENGERLSPDDITGLKNIGKGKPIIFFNACQASRPGMGLTGLSGWPKQFIDNNVSAFIGAYWSVLDETACKLSVKFYELLAAGETIAAALKKARLHVKDDGNPTWLAYTLYADPFAKITLS
jgi:hypothetical protein